MAWFFGAKLCDRPNRLSDLAQERLKSSLKQGTGCMKQNRIRAGEIDFAYLECGEGPLVLFLHGFPDNALSWTEQLRYFADRGYRAIAPYMRGYGPTAAPADQNYAPSALAADVRNLLPCFRPAKLPQSCRWIGAAWRPIPH